MRKRCINPQLGAKISNQIVFNLGTRQDIHLTPEQSQHLAECEECNQLLPLWFKKGEAAHETNKAFHIVNLAEEGDERVLKKVTRSGTALFKRDDGDSSKGLLVEISSSGSISDAQEIALDDFNRLE